MKTIFLILVLIISLSNISEAKQNDNEIEPWRNSVFLATNYGYPQGLAIDLGYNFIDYLSVGLKYGILDYWNEKTNKSSISIFAKADIPYSKSLMNPYLLLGLGKNIDVYADGPKVYFVNLSLGFEYSIIDWAQFRPELCFLFTSITESGFVPKQITIYPVNKNYFGINLVLEIDFAKLL